MKELLHINDENDISIFESFTKIAKILMNDYLLQVGETFYRIVDCEFYYGSDLHDDCYVHGHKRQRESVGEWYFHGSGLDITIAGDNSFGGILLRGIAKVTTRLNEPNIAEPIIGPLNVCTEIFRGFGPALKKAAVDFGFVCKSSTQLQPLVEARVFAVPRVGLNKIKETKDYHSRPYRFITFLHLPHREGDRVKKYLLEEAKTPLGNEAFQSYKKGKDW